MIIKQKLKNLLEGINRHKVASIVSLGLAGLVATTCLKDNVHFGAVRLNNPQENHYAWGLYPKIEIEGEKDEDINGNFYNIGLLVGENYLGDNSTITGNMRAYGLFLGVNVAGDNSTITGDMKAYGLILGGNNAGNNSTITGDMKAYGLIVGGNNAEANSTITGNIVSRGIISETTRGLRFGTNVELGLKNYVVKKEQENKK